MAKYDCTKAKDFLHELKRASEWCRKRSASECKGCEMICRDKGCFLGFARDIDCIPERQFDFAIGKMQNWSDSHPEKRELTENERNILKTFKTLGFAYIAADKNGCVCVYFLKPQKGIEAWYNGVGDYGVSAGASTVVCKTEKFFGDILSYDDEEPAEIEKLLEGDK